VLEAEGIGAVPEEGVRVPSLQRGTYLEPAPFVRALLSFARTWSLPSGLRGLSVAEMEAAWDKDSHIARDVTMRCEDPEEAIVARWALSKLSLFAVHDGEGESDQGFLLWTDAAAEPRVVIYVRHFEQEYPDVRSFLLSLIG
jgi:hypothetical protein